VGESHATYEDSQLQRVMMVMRVIINRENKNDSTQCNIMHFK
jgi:hypothetical protein